VVRFWLDSLELAFRRLFFREEFELFIAAKLDFEGEGAETRAFEEEDCHWLATAAYALGAEGIGILTG
jgi:hypothetical protein